jgi:hypothetical protein
LTNQRLSELENLIIVAGHAIFIADHFGRPEDGASWCLQPFQKGEPSFYIEHIRQGVELAAGDAASLLVFSGGRTRPTADRRSEATGYFQLAGQFNWWHKSGVEERTTTEEFARDSFENLLFSLCRFRECAGQYPQTVTVVSWAFKAPRFDLHRQAIRFPESRFHFAGANNPVDLTSARRAEQWTLEAFAEDPYGVRESPVEADKLLLGDKRKARNPFGLTHNYAERCPEIAGLLGYQGQEPYGGDLPWDRQKSPQT